MAGSFNKVILMGNLTRDPELRHLPNSNTAVCTVGLAVNRRFRTADGENREETTFIDCEAFGRTAEVLSQYLRKGRPVLLEGRLRLDQWQDKDGGNRSKLKVIVEGFQFVDSKQDGNGGGGNGGGAGGARRETAGSRPAQGGGAYEPIGDDDIPF